jgi:hypothetical protein
MLSAVPLTTALTTKIEISLEQPLLPSSYDQFTDKRHIAYLTCELTLSPKWYRGRRLKDLFIG